jgi:hypothetical protein
MTIKTANNDCRSSRRWKRIPVTRTKDSFMDTDINRHSAPISTHNNSVKSKHKRSDNISLSIFHQNIRGLWSKLDELECHLLYSLPVLLCLTEHHLTQMEILSLNTENYQLGSYYCRKHMLKGGVCMLVHRNTTFSVINSDRFRI